MQNQIAFFVFRDKKDYEKKQKKIKKKSLNFELLARPDKNGHAFKPSPDKKRTTVLTRLIETN